MSKEYIYCPKCTVLLELNGTCSSCQWKPPKDDEPAKRRTAGAGPATCQFNDHGSTCHHRAIMLVNGTWCCREHGYKLGNYRGMEGQTGNAIPRPDRAVGCEDWRNQMQAYLIEGGRSTTHRLDNGNLVQRRKDDLPDIETLMREPGCDC